MLSFEQSLSDHKLEMRVGKNNENYIKDFPNTLKQGHKTYFNGIMNSKL